MTEIVPAEPARPATAPPRLPDPVVRTIGRRDVVEAFAAGLRDFQAHPFPGLLFGAVYAAGGLLILLSAARLGAGWAPYPLAAGFVLLGPFVAVGLYEISRRRETGQPVTGAALREVMLSAFRREIGWMAFVVLFIFIVWMYQVRLLIALFLGLNPPGTLAAFLAMVLTTPEGLMFLALGHVIGAILAIVTFSLTVVSFPLLLDRDHDMVTAMITSVRAVAVNPVPMLSWAAIVVALIIVASLPAFLGLIVVLPVLGHATWHLYRRLVAPLPTA